ncbi:bromodomain-containing protein [Phthorimaea operculella]|nr:bromodomain-containing protein [Phthorimaea operculella]
MIPAARWKLVCMVCKQRGAGACIQCHKSNCYSAFHVTCAQQAGLYMKMEAAGAGRDPSQPVQVAKMAYCDTHTPAHVLQERKAQEAGDGDNKSTDLTAIRLKGREKIKQARRVLAMKRTWSPVVLVPTLPAARVASIAQMASGPPAARAQLMKRLLAYWTLKRHSRNGVPLLRRLQSRPTQHNTRGVQDGSVNVRELCNQLKYWQRIRQDLERARLLCELVRKRERLKAEYTRVWERCVMHTLRPERAALHKLLLLLRNKDTSDIFTEPVDPQEVPDYSSVVKHPMDLSTMGKRLDRGLYNTIDDVEADFQLMINNCLAYNNKDTVFYKAGIKMREQCLPIFRQARRDVISAGMVELAGSGDASLSPEREIARKRRSPSRGRRSPSRKRSPSRGRRSPSRKRSPSRGRSPSRKRSPSRIRSPSRSRRSPSRSRSNKRLLDTAARLLEEEDLRPERDLLLEGEDLHLEKEARHEAGVSRGNGRLLELRVLLEAEEVPLEVDTAARLLEEEDLLLENDLLLEGEDPRLEKEAPQEAGVRRGNGRLLELGVLLEAEEVRLEVAPNERSQENAAPLLGEEDLRPERDLLLEGEEVRLENEACQGAGVRRDNGRLLELGVLLGAEEVPLEVDAAHLTNAARREADAAPREEEGVPLESAVPLEGGVRLENAAPLEDAVCLGAGIAALIAIEPQCLTS